MNSGIQVYDRVPLQTGINKDHRAHWIQLLLDGALDKIAKAKEFMEIKNNQQKGENICLAISFIDLLRASLDMQSGGDISRNLESLYDYMTHRLTEANLKNDGALLDEISNLLLPIKHALDVIPVNARIARQQQQQQK